MPATALQTSAGFVLLVAVTARVKLHLHCAWSTTYINSTSTLTDGVHSQSDRRLRHHQQSSNF